MGVGWIKYERTAGHARPSTGLPLRVTAVTVAVGGCLLATAGVAAASSGISSPGKGVEVVRAALGLGGERGFDGDRGHEALPPADGTTPKGHGSPEGEGRGLPRTVTGSANAYDEVQDGEQYRATLTQSFSVRLAGKAPQYLGKQSFSSDATYGAGISGGTISHGATTASTGACTSVPSLGGSCLIVRTAVSGELTTSYGNHYSQDGTLITEVNRDGKSATSVSLGAVSGPNA